MYIRREVHPSVIWYFSKRAVYFFSVLSFAVYWAYAKLKLTSIALPFLPVATIGTAVAFYVGFKNNASYERLWEGRKIWAEIESLSRMWGTLVAEMSLPAEISSDEKKVLVYRQLAWINALRLMLRSTHVYQNEEIGSTQQVHLVVRKGGPIDFHSELSTVLSDFLSPEDVSATVANPNAACAIINMQIKAILRLADEGLSDEISDKLYEIVKSCSQQQSAAERLNNFPFPRQYAYFSSLFVNIFILLLPFSLLSELKTHIWLVMPFSILISWVFFTMEKVGDSSENPFENGINDVPLSSICRSIEIQLRCSLGETELPAELRAQDFVLM